MADPKFPPMAEQSCFNCRYWRRASDDNLTVNLCCRHAPMPSPTHLYAARCPAVRWCGEWSPIDG
jgi:hypothetical protein